MLLPNDIKQYSNRHELDKRDRLFRLSREAPIPQTQYLSNVGLFIESKNLARLLFLDFIYKNIVDVQGVVADFGTRWGQNAAVFTSLRGIYEPFNRHRKVLLFDTFTGFPELAPEDGDSDLMRLGQLETTPDYEHFLTSVLECHEELAPLAHIKKFEIHKGDASTQLAAYLTDHPETIFALAYFDFDLYKPTLECLELISDRIVRGSVLAFDELNDPDSPGETLAVMKALGLRNCRVKRFRYASRVSYIEIE